MKSFWKKPFKSDFPTIIQKKHTNKAVIPNLQDNCAVSTFYSSLLYYNILIFMSHKDLCNSKIFALNTVFVMGNKRNRRSRRVESQSSDRDENNFTQGNATLVEVSENVNIFDRNLGSELTESSQISNEIKSNNSEIVSAKQP